MSDLLQVVTKTLSDLILTDIRIFDFRGFSPYFDYQIIASASNERQVHAAIDHLAKSLPKDAIRRIEGASENRWILFDLGEIIVHVMHQEDRAYYKIEKLFFEREEIFLEGNKE
ncbi:MAG: ribosome silencing factor [Firmicutes bacterium]|nr:ribosome silencing factor [Bacillota bacterium]